MHVWLEPRRLSWTTGVSAGSEVRPVDLDVVRPGAASASRNTVRPAVNGPTAPASAWTPRDRTPHACEP
jgi:hypothetical protein